LVKKERRARFAMPAEDAATRCHLERKKGKRCRADHFPQAGGSAGGEKLKFHNSASEKKGEISIWAVTSRDFRKGGKKGRDRSFGMAKRKQEGVKDSHCGKIKKPRGALKVGGGNGHIIESSKRKE